MPTPSSSDRTPCGNAGFALAGALLLACACSRAPEAPASAAPPAGRTVPSPTAGTAAAHLARGLEARSRAEYARAGEELETARALFEKERNWEGYVRAWIEGGAVTERQGDYEAALEQLNAALAAAREKLGPDHPEVARALEELGTVYAATGRPREGLEHLGKALELRRAAKSGPEDTAETVRRMGAARMDLGEDEEALGLFEEAEGLLAAAPGGPDRHLADVLIGKGAAYWGQGRFDQAIEALERAVAILEADEGTNRVSLAAAYLNLGNAYWSKSDYDEARAYYEKALVLHVATYGEAHPRVGSVHFNLAILHLAQRDYEASITNAEKALRIFVPTLGERHPQTLDAYNVLGEALTAKGEPDRALAVLGKVLALRRSLPETDGRSAGTIFTVLAEAYRAKGAFARASHYHRRALAVSLSLFGKQHPDVAEDLLLLGNLHLEMGDEDEAVRYFGRSIAANNPQRGGVDPDLDPPLDSALSEEYLLKALQGAARARARRGVERQQLPELERAALVYEHASRLIERMRAGYRAEGSKLSISASAADTYDEAIRNELELHRRTADEQHLEKAFRYAEKARAGVLRDALNEADARSFAGIPAVLLEQERRLRADLASLDLRLTEAQLDPEIGKGRLQSLRDQQFAGKREYEALQQRFEREYPDYYDLKYRFETAAPAEIGKRLLDDRTVLVEYFLGRERIVIFTVAGQDLQVTSVVRDAALEADVQELRRAILERDQTAFARPAHRLYRTLLAPVEGRLAGRDLLIVPDGPLSGIPFEALLRQEPTPRSGAAAELPCVLRDHAVSYAYSATVLWQGLRRRREPPPDDLVAFAPVFGEWGARAGDAPPLPGSRAEVSELRGLFAKRQGLWGAWFSPRSRVYLGRDATEARLKAAGLKRFRYVHLATHGVVDEEHPGLSHLLLEPDPGSGEDGVLHLGEIYNLRLNADLVVLSACDTGRGRLARGEGIIGLTRGFLYAGAESLLVSLWPVSDAATSDLVVDFYRNLLAGRPKAQALREAKLRTMGRNPEYAKPYYWSSLVLVGQGH